MSPNVHFLIYFLYWIFSANIWGIYVTRRVSVRPLGAGSGKENFLMDRSAHPSIHPYISIGYLLPTFGEYKSLGGFLCALRAQGREMYIF